MPTVRGDPYPYLHQPSEARDILNALATAGMQRAAIAQALQVKAQKLKDITVGKTNGATIAARLRALYEASRSQLHEQLPALPVKSLVSSAPAPAPVAPSLDASSIPLTADIDAADQPPDERSTGERVREKVRDFLLGKDGATAVIGAAERKASSKAAASSELDDRQARFVEQIAPFAALLLVVGGNLLYQDPYKACAPLQPEADAMIRPVLRMAARQLQIAGQLSENTIDVLASLSAVALYGQRSWDTYQRIKLEEGAAPDGRRDRSRAGDDPRRGYAPAPAAYGVAPGATSGGAGRGAQSGRDAGQSAGAAADARTGQNGDESPDEQRRATALLDGVLAADAVGRRQLALN